MSSSGKVQNHIVCTIPSLHCNIAPKAKAKARAKAPRQQTPDPAKPRGKVGVLKDKSAAGYAKGWDMSQQGKPMGQMGSQAIKDHL